MKKLIPICFLSLLCFHVFAILPKGTGTKKPKNQSELLKKSQSWLSNQPVLFVENMGQIHNPSDQACDRVLFKASTPKVDLYVTAGGLSYVFMEFREEDDEKEERSGRKQKNYAAKDEQMKVRYERLDMELKGASILKENIVKEELSDAYFNFMGAPEPIYNVRQYGKLTVKNIYPGIDWVLYNTGKDGFKYDFVVRPGANPKQIELVYKSKKALQQDERGGLTLRTRNGSIQENAPYSYLAQSKQKIESHFRLGATQKRDGIYESSVHFDLPGFETFNRSETLIIDPQLFWATFYGGSSYEGVLALEADSSGNLYGVGYTASSDFPLINAGGFYQSVPGGSFLMKFSNTGVMLWATFFYDFNTNLSDLALDKYNNLFICGSAYSASGFTSVPGPSGSYAQAFGGGGDAFIAEFNSNSSCIWATFYGGSNYDMAESIATDKNGDIVMVGTTSSTNFPVVNAGGFYSASMSSNNTSAGFLVKFSNTRAVQWATYIDGISSPLVTADLRNNIYLCGSSYTTMPLQNYGGTSYYQGTLNGGYGDAFIMKFNTGHNLVWSTYYGGSNNEDAASLVTDKSGNLFIAGATTSTDLPVQNAGTYFQGTYPLSSGSTPFILKFDSTGTRKWGTFFGGSGSSYLSTRDNVDVDACGNLYFAFETSSNNQPVQNSCENGFNDHYLDTSTFSANDIFLTRFSNTGALQWASYFGGDGYDFRSPVAVDKHGNLFVAGEWTSPTNTLSYPITNPGGAYQAGFSGSDDIYLAKFGTAIQSFSYGVYCQSAAPHLPNLAQGFPTGGTFSATPGLSLNPVTGEITPNASTPGTYVVSYATSTCYCSAAGGVPGGSNTVTILSSPNLTVTGHSTVCVKEKWVYTASGATSYTWSNGANTATTSITPTVASVLLYTVSGTTGNGCISKQTITVTVNKCTGIEENQADARCLQVYPNPNSGEFTVSSCKDKELILVNELGQTQQRITLSLKNEHKAHVHGLHPGVYFLKELASTASTPLKILVNE